MIYLLADANIQGQSSRLIHRMQSPPWDEFWAYFQLVHLTFGDVGLNLADTDRMVWQRCQEKQAYLLTNNRRENRADSLQSTIRDCNTAQSLPVFTIGDANRVLADSAYCERVIVALFGYLLQADNLRGTGRLYLP